MKPLYILPPGSKAYLFLSESCDFHDNISSFVTETRLGSSLTVSCLEQRLRFKTSVSSSLLIISRLTSPAAHIPHQPCHPLPLLIFLSRKSCVAQETVGTRSFSFGRPSCSHGSIWSGYVRKCVQL